MQRPARGLGVASPRFGQRLVAIEILPGADDALARRDTVEIGRYQRLGGKLALGDLPGGLAGGQRARIGHGDLHLVALTLAHPRSFDKTRTAALPGVSAAYNGRLEAIADGQPIAPEVSRWPNPPTIKAANDRDPER